MGILDGKTCIVTGAAGSLGLASAVRFVEEGAKVMLVDRDRAGLDAALKALPEGRATAMLADVADAKATAAYVNATVARWGPIDVLFSNAGISGVIRPVTDYPEDVFDAVIAVNLTRLVPRLQVRPAEDARRRQHHHDLERGRRDQRSRHRGLRRLQARADRPDAHRRQGGGGPPHPGQCRGAGTDRQRFPAQRRERTHGRHSAPMPASSSIR